MKQLNCILLIDDDDEDNEYHQIVINRMGAAKTIKVAENGEEAITLLKDKEEPIPELIFLDINMPRMNGWEFLEEYKKLNFEKKQIIILMLTTSVNPADVERAKHIEEVTGYKVKPLTTEMLEEILRVILYKADHFRR